MLKELRIENLVLITQAQLQFKSHLHIFSGETGAGKTALFQALELIAGARFEQHLLRKGEKKAKVMARFSVPSSSPIFELLKDHLEIDCTEDLIIQRELSSEGKSKVLINCQWAPLYLLKQIAPYLLHIVSQQASQKLLEAPQHRQFFDQFARLGQELKDVKKAYENWSASEKKYQNHKQTLHEATHLLQDWKSVLDEIESAQIEDEMEEEKIYEEYQGLSTATERLSALSHLTECLYESEHSSYSLLTKELPLLSKWSKNHSDLQMVYNGLLEVSEQFKDHLFSLIQHRDQIDENPKRLEFLEERLAHLNRLKKKYGPSLRDVLDRQTQLKQKMEALDFGDEELQQLELNIKKNKEAYEKCSLALSKARQKAIPRFEKQLCFYFERLALDQAQLLIRLKKSSPSAWGSEEVEFHLQANPGEHPAPLHKRASGGELSRVLLALELISLSHQPAPTLLFDEVDSNLGGETAPKIGQLLKQVSQDKQIFCITHLPQVAVYGLHHFKIEKQVCEGRTETHICFLNQEERISEIERMLGGTGLSKKARELAHDLIRSE